MFIASLSMLTFAVALSLLLPKLMLMRCQLYLGLIIQLTA